MPLTLPMLTIEPPSSWVCMTAFAAWATCSGASRLSLTIDSENRGDAVAASAGGAPPALLTTVSIRPPPTSMVVDTAAAACSGSRRSAATKVAVASPSLTTSSGSERAVITTVAPAREEPRGDAPAHALRAAGDEHGAAGEVQRIAIGRHPRTLPDAVSGLRPGVGQQTPRRVRTRRRSPRAGPIACVQLAEQPTHVGLGRRVAHEQLVGDLGVGQPLATAPSTSSSRSVSVSSAGVAVRATASAGFWAKSRSGGA